MGVTFSIGGTSFGALTTASTGRKAIFCRQGAITSDRKRFHVPGQNGNFVILGGRDGMPIVCRARYLHTSVSAARALYRADRATWAAGEVTIVDEEGQSFERCNLVSANQVTDPKGGGGGKVWFDVVAVFTWDGGD